MGLAEDFAVAAEYVRNLPTEGPHKPTDETKLKLYSLFKQVKSGPCTGAGKPGLLDLEGKKKYAAWEKLGNMSKDDAMKAYIDELNKVKAAAGK